MLQHCILGSKQQELKDVDDTVEPSKDELQELKDLYKNILGFSKLTGMTVVHLNVFVN